MQQHGDFQQGRHAAWLQMHYVIRGGCAVVMGVLCRGALPGGVATGGRQRDPAELVRSSYVYTLRQEDSIASSGTLMHATRVQA